MTMDTPNTTNNDECEFIVYELVTRKDDTTYRHTKKRCKTQEEADQEALHLVERTSRFHAIRRQ